MLLALLVTQWRGLSEVERAPFAEGAAEDKARFGKECAARDAEVEAEQEARRQARTASVEGPRVKQLSEPPRAAVRPGTPT